MQFPHFKDKYAGDSLFSPEDHWKHKIERGDPPTFHPPKGVIFCYQEEMMEYVLKTHETTKVKGFLDEMYLLTETNDQVAIIGGLSKGAPAIVTIMEQLIALGVKRFISIGIAGTLQKRVHIGDIIICDKAIRDEGTSYHYVKPSKYAYASEKMIERMKKSLDTHNQKYFVGTSWTTDAFYRETVAEVNHYQKEGVVTVDMEASALFAVAQYRNVEIGVIFTISDSLAELQWDPRFHIKEPSEKLEILYQATVGILLG